MLKELSLNIPLLEGLEQTSGYIKFIKYLVIKKRVVSYEDFSGLHHCSVITYQSFAQEKGDPGALRILYTTRTYIFCRASCDLR